uniref:J domain-containing protein n=1 Tax=Phakopsora pachyrhizi TaxID=170000 RepID=A0A0S1MIR4_PHAPC
MLIRQLEQVRLRGFSRSLIILIIIQLFNRQTISSSSDSSSQTRTTSQLISQANSLLASGQASKALELYDQALERDPDDYLTILERLKRAQKGLKLSKQKDYYKVLGVPRNVDERALKKAYRKATLKAHPDKGGSQAKMTALNEAYEVLSNPELRARYDNGDDPNDPQSGGSNPFFQGGSGGNFHPIFQQFFQQASSGQSGGQTYSFKFG